jgi:hypothetical protein
MCHPHLVDNYQRVVPSFRDTQIPGITGNFLAIAERVQASNRRVSPLAGWGFGFGDPTRLRASSAGLSVCTPRIRTTEGPHRWRCPSSSPAESLEAFRAREASVSSVSSGLDEQVVAFPARAASHQLPVRDARRAYPHVGRIGPVASMAVVATVAGPSASASVVVTYLTVAVNVSKLVRLVRQALARRRCARMHTSEST